MGRGDLGSHLGFLQAGFTPFPVVTENNAQARPVLKHGPRSSTCVQVLTEIKHRNAK